MPRRRLDGELSAAVLQLVAEDPERSDLSIAADLDVTEQAVSRARRGLGVPGAYERRRGGWAVDSPLGRCRRCGDLARWIEVPFGARRTRCAVCDGWVYVSGVRLRQE